jgi:hypothetical protein
MRLAEYEAEVRVLAACTRGARSRADVAAARRDRAIERASAAGLTRRQLARAAGLAPGRIQQIVNAGRG